MNESLSDLLARAASLIRQGRNVVACMLVNARGSTPQSAGAIMLVDDSATTYGTVGGGCIEAEIRRHALQSLHTGESRVHTFKLNHDYGWDDGLICGGTVEIAVGRLPAPDVLDSIRADILARRATSLSLIVADDSGDVRYELSIPMRDRLFIVGAGHVGQSLAKLACDLDFETWVFDDRPDLFSLPAFANVRHVVGDIAENLASAPIDDRTAVAILTRGHKHDEQALHAVINSSAGYIGMIGSRRKIKLIHDDLINLGVSADRLAKVKAPIGLDIGAVSVNEIALAIAAELIQHRSSHVHSLVTGPMPATRASSTREPLIA
ncbi:MAG TPA: XdhC/CoxI family protein [Phycisphaerales bacterium]|nr:XdhC/CoxI family protein [Phycisphaerales bacterium]